MLHGGQGTRLRPITHTGSKQLIKIAGKPVSRWMLEKIRDLGIEEFIIVLGENDPRSVIDYYGDGSALGVRIKYLYQGKARGIADAIYRCRGMVGENEFIVALGDNVLIDPIPARMVEAGNSVLLARVRDPSRFGVAVISEDRIVKMVEKPKEFISDLALVGIYKFSSEIFQEISKLRPSARGELEITEAIQGLIQDGFDVNYEVVGNWWKDTGTPEDLLEANMYLLDAYAQRYISGSIVDSEVLGRVYLGQGSRIINSKVIGPCFIGENTTVADSTVEPFCSIGDGASIERSNLSYSLVMDGARISRVSLTRSIIGKNVKLERAEGSEKGVNAVLGENSTVILR
ncbi:glucose-1-phosphate thymidylyltransferase [Thermogymnomonas acidicola]|uniref:Glucose-1-phosphate thymidylyltransferase n=1 Tax=Thermogymnomonas acidicola TaxID=399579 RepID=A0AA37F9W6_9ARCH|nr:glucose-1-phosphate thymidylyltransferase [Thermogymnomonas acidicola]